jgi:hypothetical protein
MQLGLTPPAPQPANIGGFLPVQSLASMQAQEAVASAAQRAAEANNQPVVSSLAGHIRNHWSLAKRAKMSVEQEMLNAVRARRGEYDPQTLAKIQQQGGSEIYMMLFATKARQAKALLSDVLIGAGTEKPWSIAPTPKPELPPDQVQEITQAIYQQVAQAEMMGLPLSIADIRQQMLDAKHALENQVMETARIYADRAETKIEDMMVEGHWLDALDQFLDDMMVFKTAFMKGPILRNKRQLKWVQGPDGAYVPETANERKLEWERVDPLNIYPAAWARSVHDAYLIERHRLSRGDLNELIGVDGYSEDAIKAVLEEHGRNGLTEWTNVDAQRASAEGRDTLAANANYTDLIDALQYWGSVSGEMLRDWGMTEEEVPDATKEYEVEAWLIGNWVIKAVINPDPLYRRPYYADGYSRVPGAFWHNSLYDIIRDCQDMCNSAARALSNNLGVASGPQVNINVDRLPAGEDITEMYPWKIWQTTSDPMGSTAKAIDFFQPSSNANELMGVFQRFADLADEYSGIPKYMTGLAGGEGGAGRTASGMSMMIGNASKQIKQLVTSIDMHVIAPSVERTYQWLMEYDPDSDLKGDLKVVARGAMSLMTKEAATVRRNEFLQFTGNPIDMQIIGLEGRAEVLRESAKALDINPDKVVPSNSVIRQRMMIAQMQAQQMAQQQAQQPQQGKKPNPDRQGGSGQALQNGAPTTDNFSPTPQ